MDLDINYEEDIIFNTFTFTARTEEMILFQNENYTISLKHILELTKDWTEICVIKLTPYLNLEIDYINKSFICFTINNIQAFYIFRNPIEISINGIKIEIVCDEQLEYFAHKIFKEPTIFCYSCNIATDLNIRYLHIHLRHFYRIADYLDEEIKPLSEEDAASIIK